MKRFSAKKFENWMIEHEIVDAGWDYKSVDGMPVNDGMISNTRYYTCDAWEVESPDKLTHYIKVYVPQESNKSDTILNVLTMFYDGCSKVSGIGTWLSPQGDVVRENVDFMISWDAEPIKRIDIYMLADILLTAGEQSVALEIDGTFHLIDKTTIGGLLA